MNLSPSNFLSVNRKSKMPNRKWVGVFAIFLALTACGAKAEAQQAKKVPRIGLLTTGSILTNAEYREAFRQGLRDLGYVDGKNVVIESRGADGRRDRVPV